MPLYTYECTNCGVVFERQQKFTDTPIKRCPECKKGTIKKLIQPAGIIFKGSGWYKTDSRSSSTDTGASKPGKKSAAKTESNAETKKPEAKSADTTNAASAPSAPASKPASDD